MSGGGGAHVAWPQARPPVPDFEAGSGVGILGALTDAYRCIRAMHCLLREGGLDEHVGGGSAAAGPEGQWPGSLPPALETRGDFAWLAVACRGLQAWLVDVDFALQSTAAADSPAADDDVAVRQLLETAGWWMTRASQDALHLAALAMGGAGGLWARDAALRVLRGACSELNDAITSLGPLPL